jgi:hypothetical protein
MQLGFLAFILGRCVLWMMQSGATVAHHPVEQFINEAKWEHDLYRRQALSSASLDDAAETYLRRYNRYAPPGFDHW